jgi:hypothetical protein
LNHTELTRTLARIQTWPLILDVCRSIKALEGGSRVFTLARNRLTHSGLTLYFLKPYLLYFSLYFSQTLSRERVTMHPFPTAPRPP